MVACNQATCRRVPLGASIAQTLVPSTASFVKKFESRSFTCRASASEIQQNGSSGVLQKQQAGLRQPRLEPRNCEIIGIWYADAVQMDFAMPADAQHRSVTITYAGSRLITLETGEMGRLAAGSVMLTAGETKIYSNACAERTPMSGGFTPLQVSYHERLSAGGRTACAPPPPNLPSNRSHLWSFLQSW